MLGRFCLEQPQPTPLSIFSRYYSYPILIPTPISSHLTNDSSVRFISLFLSEPVQARTEGSQILGLGES